MVIHGAIDRYSRLIVYLNCCNNNLAEIVLDLFLKVVQACSCPLHVRGDRRVENTQVADYMINQGGSCRNHFICGQSVHNQSIERLWRNLYTGCTVIYYRLFYYMKDIKILDPDNHLDLFCLQFVFIPRINTSLEQFTATWNNHPLCSASNRSPYQLWILSKHPESFTSVSIGDSRKLRESVYYSRRITICHIGRIGRTYKQYNYTIHTNNVYCNYTNNVLVRFYSQKPHSNVAFYLP